MKSYRILDWDSNFFGLAVAKVLPARLDHDGLGRCLAQMKAEGVRLAYWASDPADEASQEGAWRQGGFLADRKVTYAADAGRILSMAAGEPAPVVVEEYASREVTPELEQLALQAGIFSRFKVDPKMPVGTFEELYRIWIRSSAARTIAEVLYVVRYQETIAGMVAVGEKNGRADIGLIAVDDMLRGQGAGQALVLAARNWGIARGFASAQVVTQGDNVPACRFYEKCGYGIDKVENIYHFWIKS